MPGGSSRQYVATGFGGNGMIYGTISGIILSNLIVTGQSEYKDLFDPVRIKPIAEFSNFVKENFDVAKEYISALFQRDKLESLSDLAHGEAKVIRYDGQKVGIYKDEAGELHVVNPTCTHAKCTIGWNSSERSWDCPCHGARFDCDGNVITSPATEALKRITIQDTVTI
jgi:Rieske Fe-S protein